MNVLLFIRGCGDCRIDHEINMSLHQLIKKKHWSEAIVYIDESSQPLMEENGSSRLLEVMNICTCSILLVSDALQLSKDPYEIMEFNALAIEKDMQVFLQLENQFLNEWTYEYKLANA